MSSLLSEWQVRSTLPPRFQERVWQRIALAEAGGLRPRWMEWGARLQAFLARPRLAAGSVTALLLLGFAMGWVRGLEQSARMERALSSRYVQTLDPYQSAPH